MTKKVREEIVYELETAWPTSKSVKELREAAARKKKKDPELAQVQVKNRAIVKSLWGEAWCRNLASYETYAHRLARGRTYLREGCVFDLELASGHIRSKVNGNYLYEVDIRINEMEEEGRQRFLDRAAKSLNAFVDLLAGSFSQDLIEFIVDPETGLFPRPDELYFSCTCPDNADLCKHVAATLYGVAAEFDADPGVFFTLRGIDAKMFARQTAAVFGEAAAADTLSGDLGDLSKLFSIDLKS